LFPGNDGFAQESGLKRLGGGLKEKKSEIKPTEVPVAGGWGGSTGNKTKGWMARNESVRRCLIKRVNKTKRKSKISAANQKRVGTSSGVGV